MPDDGAGQLEGEVDGLVGDAGGGLLAAAAQLLGGGHQRGDGHLVLALAALLLLLMPLRHRGRGRSSQLERLTAALGPADGVALGARGVAGLLRKAAQGSLGHLVAENGVAPETGPHSGAQVGARHGWSRGDALGRDQLR